MISNTKSNRPDVTLANRISAMFEDDPEIFPGYINATEDKYGILILRVKNAKKAAAIKKLLRPLYDNIATPLVIEIEDISGVNDETIKDAFEGNPHFNSYVVIDNPFDPIHPFYVCVFNKEVIQFPNDNGGSLHGYEFRLMEDLAREAIFDQPMLFFTTDDGIEEK